MQQCKQRAEIAERYREFPSKSNPDKVYKAYAFRDGELPMCTCMPFLTGRKKLMNRLNAENGTDLKANEVIFTCSHLKELIGDVCQWVEDDPIDGGYQYDDKCPRCHGPLVNSDGSTSTDRADMVNELQAMREELGGPAAVPIEIPKFVLPTYETEVSEFDDRVLIEVRQDGRHIVGLSHDIPPHGQPDEGPRLIIWDEPGETIASSMPLADLIAFVSHGRPITFARPDPVVDNGVSKDPKTIAASMARAL